jgi:alkyl sulfatase BDS1-like metallo-beta-lactamase superfamily hydrolase
MNHGWKAAEIAERLALPQGLAETWHARGYYGTLSHNAKAVYQRYLGWYDANPAHLAPLPPVPRARKYVEYMGGAAAARERARADFARGEYRFVAEAMSLLVFADPADAEARGLAADALEQLGYQAESATWRNAYLLGAQELRGATPSLSARASVSPDVVRAMPLDLFFDYLAVRLDGERAQGRAMTINWILTDTDERYTLTLARSALTYRAGRQRADAAATVRLTRPVLDRLVLRELTLDAALAAGTIVVEGERARLAELFDLLDDFALMFPVVEPRRDTEPAALDSAPPRP